MTPERSITQQLDRSPFVYINAVLFHLQNLKCPVYVELLKMITSVHFIYPYQF